MPAEENLEQPQEGPDTDYTATEGETEVENTAPVNDTIPEPTNPGQETVTGGA